MNKRTFGGKYEETAAAWLKNKGYELLSMNFSSPYGEADIIMKDKSEFVFIEVKTRTSLKYGLPAEAVTKSKQKKYLLTAQYYFMTNGIEDYNVRFDVIQVYISDNTPYINHIENAFDFTDSRVFY